MKVHVPGTALLSAVLASSSIFIASVGMAGGPAALPEPAPSPTVQSAMDAFLAAHPDSRLSIRGGGITRVYGKAFADGPSPIDAADAFVAAHAPMFGTDTGSLLPIGPFADGSRIVPLSYDPATDSYRFTLVTYTQHVEGVPVFRSDLRVLVRNEPGFPAVLASSSLRDLGDFAVNGGNVVPSKIDSKTLLRVVGNQFGRQPTISDAEMVIWAGVDHEPQAPRLAYSFLAEGGLLFQPETYKKFRYVVDAQTGRILFQENQICEVGLTGSVQGVATLGSGADLCAEEVATGMPYAAVTVDGVTYYADANGNFSIDAPGSPLTASSTLGGKYFTVNDNAGPVSSVALAITGGLLPFLHNADNQNELVRAQVNAYLHANIIRDTVMAANPAYPVISGQVGDSAFPINVNLAQTCNAFYNGGSINFYQAGGGCANTAFATVVHHEFGHHVVASGGSGQGPYGEGMSDCMGILVTDESVTGFGFSNNCSSGIRNADNDCLYQTSGCSSCGSAVHSCGRLISGCVWDLRTNWAALYPDDYRERLRDIVINSVPLHGPVTSINPDITIDFLTLDDDNADIGDGTPNYASIADAFGQHDMPAPPILAVKFSFPDGIPSDVSPAGTTLLNVVVEGVASQPQPGTGSFFWRAGTSGAFQTIAMTQVSPNVYQVAVPASVCLSTVQFYFSAKATNGVTQTNPANAPTSVYSAVSASGSDIAFGDEMELPVAGWQAGLPGDTASSGLWVRVDPNGTAAQPENDNTPDGTQAWITGQGSPGGALGENDIDGGVTTLISPVFDATGFDEVFVTYTRWYSNNTGSTPNTDSMPVQISSDGGSTWTTLETVTENANAWVFKSFRIADFVTPTATMRLRWLASDLGQGSLVEAGVDDLAIVGYLCTAPVVGDLNDDGLVNAADLSILLSAWGGTGAADLNGDGSVNAADLSILLSNWG